MSGILALVPRDGRVLESGHTDRILAALRRRGRDRVDTRGDRGTLLGVARHDWEMAAGLAGGALMVDDGEIIVAADASLYARDTLRRALDRAGVPSRADSPAHLLLAAFRAWGARCVDHLEGDYAFAAWDRRSRELTCCRDWVGTRPLFYAELSGGLVVASSLATVLAHPDCPTELDLGPVAAAASGLFAADHETPFPRVSRLLAGHTLCWSEGRAEVVRHWSPPPVQGEVNGADAPSFEAGAERLREMLGAATTDRMSRERPTGIWLSGGYDSAAVFAAGEAAARRSGAGGKLHPVSISYPPDDPGREDELIEMAAGHWQRPVRWLDIRDIPLLDRAEERAAARDEPFSHTFEMWNRALALGAREVGARIALVGAGGDPLFSVSPVFLADLLRTGRVLRFAREWRSGAMRGGGVRVLARWAVLPMIPERLRAVAAAVRGGRALRTPMERSLPAWMEPAFARRHALIEKEVEFTPRREGGSHVEHEMHWYLTHPFAARIASEVFAYGLEQGVEVRLPLYDGRVVHFAASRPRIERYSSGEGKRLLRASVGDLLPEAFLRARRTRTGTTGAYFRRSLQREHADLLRSAFADPALARVGAVDGARLRAHTERYLEGSAVDAAVELQLFFTLQAELWLRTRVS